MEGARQLILQAFEQARASGKPDWHRMTTAVLKNRLLSLTCNAFNEAAYGAPTFGSFVATHDDTVYIDNSRFPPMVELRPVVSERIAPSYKYPPSNRPRVRSDLWLATLDYSSESQYAWDSAGARARPKRDEDDDPVIRTVTQAEFQGWQKEFVDKVLSANAVTTEQGRQVDVWLQRQLPTSQLPRHLIPQWNGFLRDKVHRHLLQWFAESGLSTPSDLLTSAPVGRLKDTSPETEDATNLYRRIHRARVGVWQVGDSHVLIKPEPNPKARDYVRLGRFVDHKAFHARMSTNDFHSRWPSSLTDFVEWLDQTGCEGEGDPRCVPLHVFATKFPTSYLSTGEGRSEFAGVHGVQSSRVDDSHLHWDRPKGAFHGREVLQVAGRNLARGFHWDVSSRTTTRRITTTSEIWRISPNGYVNVYPDQYIRIGQRARRLLPGKKAKAR